MKIAFITYYPKKELKPHHAVWFYILKSLEELGHEVIVIDDLKTGLHKLYSLKSKILRMLGYNHFNLMDKRVTKSIARIVTSRLNKIDGLDLIFAPGTIEIAYLKTKIPIYVWTDTPFVGLVDYYESYKNLSSKFVLNGIEFDKTAHQIAKKVIYPSDWAKELAINEYQLNEDKFEIINFPATIDNHIDFNRFGQIVDNRIDQKLKLLFVGIEWERKGGEYIIAVLNRLKEMNYDFQLDIAGISPDIPANLKENVFLHGFLNKNNPKEFQKLCSLYEEATFLFIPSLAETYGLVFAEASAYGLPSISSKTGGIPSVIIDNKNGFTFEFEELVEKTIETIVYYKSKPMEYKALAERTIVEYKERLNWDKAKAKLEQILKNIDNN